MTRTPFPDLIDRFVDDLLAADPVVATLAGRTEHDAELPDLSAEGHRRRSAAESAWLDRFRAIRPDELTADERIDRELAIMSLRSRQIMHEWGDWLRSPDAYVQAGLSGVQLLFVHRLRPEPELVEAAAARLAAVPDVLAAARANLDPELASPLIVGRAVRQARAAVGWARDAVPQLVADEGARRRLATAGEAAAAAYDALVTHLEDLAERASGDWAIGAERYDALLREAEGLDFGSDELHRRGAEAYDQLAGELRRRSRELRGDEDWAALLDDLSADHPPTPEAMLDAYAEWSERARRFCRERDLMSFAEGEECVVEPAPPFQRGVFAVAYYIRPPAFTGSRRGHFFVPYPPEDAPPEQVRERLAGNGYAKIPTTAVHEAYPGHHWHLSWAAGQKSPLRRILSTSYFSEGWALYAEQLLREQGFYTDPRHEVGQLAARLFRAARIVVDTALHAGRMTYEEAVTHMRTRAGLPEEVARTEVTRYCAWPTQAASYLTGALEIERMRDAWVAQGRGPLKEFHDRLAGSGSLPIALAERAVLGEG